MALRKTDKVKLDLFIIIYQLLLMFDLNGVLGYVNKDVKTFNSKGIYTEGDY